MKKEEKINNLSKYIYLQKQLDKEKLKLYFWTSGFRQNNGNLKKNQKTIACQYRSI